ncbi:MAG: SDR family NAD(P)-dependent oxidoreductase [Pirellulaceae bacterium]
MSQNIVVVGGSRGIGLEVVRLRASLGDNVTVLSRTEGQLGELVDLPGSIVHQAFDATQDELEPTVFPEAISGLVYCPGSINLRSFHSLKPEQFREDFELNVVGAIKAVQAALKPLKASGSGSVILYSTVAVQQGLFAHASVAASKGALEALTRTMAAEFAPAVRVNCLAPALTETSLTERFFSNPEKAQALAEKYPMGRTGKPEDLASLTSFLLNPESSWITGQVIGVDGGMSTLRR